MTILVARGEQQYGILQWAAIGDFFKRIFMHSGYNLSKSQCSPFLRELKSSELRKMANPELSER